MSKTVRARMLVRALEKEEMFVGGGYEASLGGRLGDVILVRSGHVVGIWRCEPTKFEWTRVGRNSPCLVTEDLQEAVEYTMKWIGETSR